MDNIEFVRGPPLGLGSFGCVRKAIVRDSGVLVAVKTLAKPALTWQDVISLREVQCLMRLNHPNIVRLHQVIRDDDCKVHLVFEFVSGSLLNHMRKEGDDSNALSETQVRNLIYQLLQGLIHLHERSIAHRDLKPENVLLDRNYTVKICDLGLARVITDEPPFTSYHATRWYRAPELLLQASMYSTAVDMWALGCLMSELYTGRPLFPGTSETNQLLTICAIKGSPSEETWPDGMALTRKMRLNLPFHEAQVWSAVCPGMAPETIQLMEAALCWDPKRRVTAKEAVSFPIFDIQHMMRFE